MTVELIKQLTAELESSTETIAKLILEIERLQRREAFHTEARAAHQRHIDELQAIVNKLPHMDEIETAILAINCGSGDEFREDFCQCDHEVGVTMCVHCAVWDVLRKVKAARRAEEGNR